MVNIITFDITIFITSFLKFSALSYSRIETMIYKKSIIIFLTKSNLIIILEMKTTNEGSNLIWKLKSIILRSMPTRIFLIDNNNYNRKEY